mgnify:CR=1 FL=1
MKTLPKARVELFSVTTKDIRVAETLTGRLIPKQRVQLRFEVSGQVVSRLVEPGQSVDQGQVLLKLDDADYRNVAIDARSKLDIEKAAITRDHNLLKLSGKNRQLQQKEVKRQERLIKKSLTSYSRLDAARQQLAKLQVEESRLQFSVDSSAARLAISQASRDTANRNLQRTRLVSPMKSKVNRVLVQAGDYASPAQIVVELIDSTELEFLLFVRGEIAHRIKQDTVVKVKVDEKIQQGRIIALQEDPDDSTFTHELRVRLPAGVGYAGQMVQAEIYLPPLRQVLVVPVTALTYDNGQQYVMVYQHGKIQRQMIKPGPRIGNEQVVSSGVTQGEKVVARDVASLSDNQEVTIIKTAGK